MTEQSKTRAELIEQIAAYAQPHKRAAEIAALSVMTDQYLHDYLADLEYAVALKQARRAERAARKAREK